MYSIISTVIDLPNLCVLKISQIPKHISWCMRCMHKNAKSDGQSVFSVRVQQYIVYKNPPPSPPIVLSFRIRVSEGTGDGDRGRRRRAARDSAPAADSQPYRTFGRIFVL